MIGDLDDASARCPGFESTEYQEGTTMTGAVTILSYQRYKFRLYKIATPIAKTIYFHKGATVSQMVDEVREIHLRLVELDRSIPPELRLGSHRNGRLDPSSDPVVKIFQLQALALQLSYDNIQLLLHRPLLAYTTQLQQPISAPNTDNSNGDQNPDMSSAPNVATVAPRRNSTEFSKTQCWDSAMKTSQIGQHSRVLQTARSTHAASYIGIQTFTAGVMLAMFALRDPRSQEAQEAKGAIGRLIKTPKLCGLRSQVFTQSERILRGLLRLVLAEEMKALVSDDIMDQGGLSGDADVPLTSKSTSRHQTPPPTGNNRLDDWSTGVQTQNQQAVKGSAADSDSMIEAPLSTSNPLNFDDAQSSLHDGMLS
jgi:hypothetical protein